MKIIILDSNIELSKSLGFFFQLHGHNCLTVDDPTNALSYVNAFEPDALISEYQDDDNYLMLFRLVCQQQKKTKTIILTSCDCQLSEQKKLRELGISAIIRKPVMPDDLLAIIQTFEKKHFLSFLKTG